MRFYPAERVADVLESLEDWYCGGYVLWVSFVVDQDRLDVIREKLDEVYGVSISDAKRAELEAAGGAVAHALAFEDRRSGKYRVMLMATPAAVTQRIGTAWRREAWQTTPVEMGPYVLNIFENGAPVHWVLKKEALQEARKDLAGAIDSGDMAEVLRRIEALSAENPPFEAIQRQVGAVIAEVKDAWRKGGLGPWVESKSKISQVSGVI